MDLKFSLALILVMGAGGVSGALAQQATPVRNSCGPKLSAKSPSNRIVRECQLAELGDVIAHNEEVAEYYWCLWQLSRRAKEEKYDEVTWNLVNGQVSSGLALVRGTSGRLKGPKGKKDTLDALEDIQDSLDSLKNAAQIADKGFADSAMQDEYFRLFKNAIFQAANAEKLLNQMKTRVQEEPDCPPEDDDVENLVFSGGGITVTVLGKETARVETNCLAKDKRIKRKAPSGTAMTIGVGKSEIVRKDFKPETEYRVFDRCNYEERPGVTFVFP